MPRLARASCPRARQVRRGQRRDARGSRVWVLTGCRGEGVDLWTVSALWVYQTRYRIPVTHASAGAWVLLEGVDASVSKTATIVEEFSADGEEALLRFDEGGIEVLSPGNRSMVAGARRQWIAALGTERRANHDVTDRLPGGHGTRIEVEEFEFAKRKGRQAVSAALVSGELGAVEDVHLTSGPGEKGGRRRAGRTGADDGDLEDGGGGGHQVEARGPSCSVRCRGRWSWGCSENRHTAAPRVGIER